MSTRNPITWPVDVFNKENLDGVRSDMTFAKNKLQGLSTKLHLWEKIKRLSYEIWDAMKLLSNKNINKLFEEGETISERSQIQQGEISDLKKSYEDKISHQNKDTE